MHAYIHNLHFDLHNFMIHTICTVWTTICSSHHHPTSTSTSNTSTLIHPIYPLLIPYSPYSALSPNASSFSCADLFPMSVLFGLCTAAFNPRTTFVRFFISPRLDCTGSRSELVDRLRLRLPALLPPALGLRRALRRPPYSVESMSVSPYCSARTWRARCLAGSETRGLWIALDGSVSISIQGRLVSSSRLVSPLLVRGVRGGGSSTRHFQTVSLTMIKRGFFPAYT